MACLRGNNAEGYQKDFCSKFYKQKDDSYLLCLLENGSAYDEEYCEIRYRDDKKQRLKCFDLLKLKSYNICNQKEYSKDVDALGLTSCKADDYRCDLDENHVRKQCVKRYVSVISNPSSAGYKNALQKDPDLVKGKENWKCYPQAQIATLKALSNKKDSETSATVVYTVYDPVATDVTIHEPENPKECYEAFAKNNVADRDFCIQQTSTKEDRLQCFENIRIKKDRDFCETFNLADSDAKYKCLEGILDEDGKQISYKAEYCRWNFYRPEQYEEKWACYEGEQKNRDSEYCKDKYNYMKYFKPEEYRPMDEVNCYFEIGFPMTKEECKLVNDVKREEYN